MASSTQLEQSIHQIETAKLYAYIGITTVYVNFPMILTMGTAVIECAQAAMVVLQVFVEFLNAGIHLRGFNVGYGAVETVNPVNGIVEKSEPYVAIYGLGSQFNQRTARALAAVRKFGEVIVSETLHSEEQLIQKAAETPNGYLATCASKAIPCGADRHNCDLQLRQAGLTPVPMTWTRWKLPTCFAR
jgi:hypothetical protein